MITHAWMGRSATQVLDTGATLDFVRVRFLRAQQALTPEELLALAGQVRQPMLRWFAHSVLLDADDARAMLAWDDGGFSLDASVHIASQD